MKIPIYVDGQEQGSLTLEKRGPWILAEASLRPVGRVVRLTVYGERSFYLGVPVPEGDQLRLTRRLSAAEAARLPREPAYAGEEPMPEAEEKKPRTHLIWLGGRPHYF